MLNDAPLWVLVLLAIAMWLMWAMTVMITERRTIRLVSTPPRAEVDDAQPEAAQAHQPHAAPALHRVRTPGDGGDDLAGRAPARRDGRGRADAGELRPGALRPLPVVQAEVQPVSRREAGRSGHEPRQDRSETERARDASVGEGRAVVYHARGVPCGWWCEVCYQGRAELNGFGASVGAQLHNAECHS